ncbi:copper amine oxidase [Paenibacillus sp. IB182496]|uniref:Copper amine oxidase n=1 Tax=Paenibacillus sabuli TaxID=2772509 RepID=A0A927GSV4_9BACL|nr:stalk domain-containing protein [Paenibacillus sabuli]MBD2846062.1 copper amine oxidase [Paenibacillus sabuli]
MKKRWHMLTAAALTAALLIPAASGAAQAPWEQDAPDLALYEVRTYTGSGEAGYAEGDREDAAFRMPGSLALMPEGGLLVSDTGNQRLRVVREAQTRLLAGAHYAIGDSGQLAGAFADGTGAEAFFSTPTGIALRDDGTVLVADADNHAIRAVAPDGTVRTVAGDGLIGNEDGKTAEARFYYPTDVAIAPDGAIYVADTLNHTIRRISDGRVTTIGQHSDRVTQLVPGYAEPIGDYADGPLEQALFNEPSGLALDSKGNLYVSDTGNQRIRYIDFAAGTVSTVAGTAGAYEALSPYAEGGYADGPAAQARFQAPRGIVALEDGALLIADSGNHAIRLLSEGEVRTIAGTPGDAGSADGVASAAGFDRPVDVALGPDGVIYVADLGNNRIRTIAPYAYPAALQREDEVQLLYGADRLETDTAPVIAKGTTFVPVRVIAERLGYTVEYRDGEAVVTKGGRTYTLRQGSTRVAIVDASGIAAQAELLAAPVMRNNRMLLPVRFFAEEAGLDVQWLPDVRAVLLRDSLF